MLRFLSNDTNPVKTVWIAELELASGAFAGSNVRISETAAPTSVLTNTCLLAAAFACAWVDVVAELPPPHAATNKLTTKSVGSKTFLVRFILEYTAGYSLF